ncbi:MAG: hypothetical protein MUC68_10395 [Burkholderiaceae bacterium]|jgi:putative chitinase|nr:hypothetical protein [Burkholderiaceae bacterium]
MITPQLLQDATGCTPERAELFAGWLSEACRFYEINTTDRLAAFLAQIGHESGSFKWLREIADGSAYEGRKDLGNVNQGDGTRYRGRGLIQVTGRDNYRQMGQLLAHQGAPDFEASPEALEEPQWAAWSAAAWWGSRNLNALADAGDFDRITRRINGGTNGAADRRARWERAKAVLANQPAPAEVPLWIEGPEWPKEQSMPAIAPIIAAVLPSLIESIPKLGRVFGSGSQVAERNIKAAEVVVEAVTAATGAVNAQDAAEKIRADPVARAAAEKAVESIWYELTEAGGGGVEGARKANTATMESGIPLWRNPAFLISLVLILMPMMLLVDVLFVHPGNYTGELRVQIVTAVLAVVGMVAGYWIGTSFSSARKTELTAR